MRAVTYACASVMVLALSATPALAQAQPAAPADAQSLRAEIDQLRKDEAPLFSCVIKGDSRYLGQPVVGSQGTCYAHGKWIKSKANSG